jgi:hypothetical protein
MLLLPLLLVLRLKVLPAACMWWLAGGTPASKLRGCAAAAAAALLSVFTDAPAGSSRCVLLAGTSNDTKPSPTRIATPATDRCEPKTTGPHRKRGLLLAAAASPAALRLAGSTSVSCKLPCILRPLLLLSLPLLLQPSSS